MSVRYRPVQWTRFKLVFDAALLAFVFVYLGSYQYLAHAVFRGPSALSAPILAMRAWGSCAFVLLTLILCIGPLARLDRRFLPLLYNRRHAGVIMALVASMHAYQVLGFYFAYGKLTKPVALLTYDGAFTSDSVPFIRFGVVALLIVILMAATSHDFWQRFLGPVAWKSLHMLVYAAYVCTIAHVLFGAAQRNDSAIFTGLVIASAVLVTGLHVAAAQRSRGADDTAVPTQGARGHELWIDAGPIERVRENRARAVCPPGGERIAIVNRAGLLYAVHGACAHQGGPLAEGRVIDGCLTCPWHGWQYRPEDGRSPPPFQELLPTYRLMLKDGHIMVDPRPLPAGTKTTPVPARPARVSEVVHEHA
jgi:nitrite reductase/ring-hydroxylating ferredoxin subunit/DMSO/TMAO reductase YedYZ heme-binding membrane subunit